MPSTSTLIALASLLAVPALATADDSSRADEGPHLLGPHPAVVVQRLQAIAGYDHASKFYPHPAWLYLRAAPPPDEVAPRAIAQRSAEVPPRFHDTTQ